MMVRGLAWNGRDLCAGRFYVLRSTFGVLRSAFGVRAAHQQNLEQNADRVPPSEASLYGVREAV